MRMKKKVIIAGAVLVLVGVIAAVIIDRNRVPDFVYTKLEDGTYEFSNYCGEETEIATVMWNSEGLDLTLVDKMEKWMR